jgi:hypothetical protein
MTDAQVENSTPSKPNSGTTLPEGVDWWNVTTPEDNTIDTASFPLDTYAPLLPHDTGCGCPTFDIHVSSLIDLHTVSEIAIERCMVGQFMAQLCYPHSTVEQDAIKGKWVRVENDLNMQSGLWHLVRYFPRSSFSRTNLVAVYLLPAHKTS